MMVKPPSQFWRSRVLEMDDRVLLTVKLAFVKQLGGPMSQSCVFEARLGIDLGLVEPREDGGRSRAVETLVVKEDANMHRKGNCYEYRKPGSVARKKGGSEAASVRRIGS